MENCITTSLEVLNDFIEESKIDINFFYQVSLNDSDITLQGKFGKGLNKSLSNFNVLVSTVSLTSSGFLEWVIKDYSIPITIVLTP